MRCNKGFLERYDIICTIYLIDNVWIAVDLDCVVYLENTAVLYFNDVPALVSAYQLGGLKDDSYKQWMFSNVGVGRSHRSSTDGKLHRHDARIRYEGRELREATVAFINPDPCISDGECVPKGRICLENPHSWYGSIK